MWIERTDYKTCTAELLRAKGDIELNEVTLNNKLYGSKEEVPNNDIFIMATKRNSEQCLGSLWEQNRNSEQGLGSSWQQRGTSNND